MEKGCLPQEHGPRVRGEVSGTLILLTGHLNLIPERSTGSTSGVLDCDHVSPSLSQHLVHFTSYTSDQSPDSTLTISLSLPASHLYWAAWVIVFYNWTSSLRWIPQPVPQPEVLSKGLSLAVSHSCSLSLLSSPPSHPACYHVNKPSF